MSATAPPLVTGGAGARANPFWPGALAGAALAAAILLTPPTVIGTLFIALLVTLALLVPAIGLGGILVTGPIYLILSPGVPRGLPFSFLLLVLTIVGLLVRRVHEPRLHPIRWQGIDFAAALLLVNGLLYIPAASTLGAGIYGYHENLRLFLIYFVVRFLEPGAPAARGMLGLSGFIFFGVCAYGVIQSFVGYEWVMHHYGLTESLRDYAGFQKAGIRRSYSVLSSPLSLGMMGMIATFGGLSILLGSRRRDALMLAAPLLIAAGIGSSALSYTRSSWIGLGAGVGAGLLVVARGKARLLLIAAPLLVAAVVAWLVPNIGERVAHYAATIVSTDPSDTSFHYVALFEAARFFWQHKLGVGLGAASFSGFTHGSGVRMWSENTFFLVGIQMGMQALIALVLFLGAGARLGIRLSLRGGEGNERRLGAMIFLSTVGFAFAGISHPALLDVAAMAPVWVMLALAANHEDRVPPAAQR